MERKGQSLTEIKTQISTKIINNNELIKALVVPDEDFLNAIPSPEQNSILNDPSVLIRQQIMLTKNITARTNKDIPYITSAFTNFKKESHNYQSGKVWFYIIVPNSLEKTNYGIRYDFIGDKLDDIFSNIGIGRFEFAERGDLLIDENFLGHYISFEIYDFGRW